MPLSSTRFGLRETDVPGLFLKPSLESVAASVQTGAQHSIAFPVTDQFDANDIGQCYYGPVVLITDPFCYSAAELFAAGFQDHQIGEILGVGRRTGGGGANVWQHSLLTALLSEEDGFQSLGDAAGMTVAIRRSLRVGQNTGELLEDFGAAAEHEYRMTRGDLLRQNEDLNAKAVQLLKRMVRLRPAPALRITNLKPHEGGVRFKLMTRNLRRVDLYLDNRPVGARTVQDGKPRYFEAAADGPPPRRLRVLGFRSLNGAEPVAPAAARV